MKRKIFVVATAFATMASVNVNAEGNHSYTYNSQTGYEVPYTVVTKDALQEPAVTVGEVREDGIDSGRLSLLLPNGNTIKMKLPTSFQRWEGGRDGYNVNIISSEPWEIYNSEGLLLQNVHNDELKYYEASTNTCAILPVFYKGNLYSGRYGDRRGEVSKIDMNTFAESSPVSETSYYAYENEYETLYERTNYYAPGGGFEIVPGNFVAGEETSYIKFGEEKSDFFNFSSKGYFYYSCDGVNIIKIACPESAYKFTHYIVKQTNCIAIKFKDGNEDKYAAYSMADLQKCWNEACCNTPKVFLSGKQLSFTQPSVIIDGTTFVPVRYLLSVAGATVTWDEEERHAEIEYYDKKIVISESGVSVNGEEVKLDAPARIINDKMMIPLRFVSEELGFTVNWKQETKSIYVEVPVDGVYRRFSMFPVFEPQGIDVVINGQKIAATVSCEGQTMVPTTLLGAYFSFTDENGELHDLSMLDYHMFDYSYDKYELVLNLKYDYYDLDIWKAEIYAPEQSRGSFNPTKKLRYKDSSIPVYKILVPLTANVSNDYNYISLEESADRIDCMHYEWIAEENTLYVYIQNSMVTYDNALKAILDKKGIEYNTDYTGDYYIDIAWAQEVSKNDLPKLVQAGIDSGIIKESDYPDGRLRSTRNISHIDLARMLKGIGYDYKYTAEMKNTPVTQEELETVIGEL